MTFAIRSFFALVIAAMAQTAWASGDSTRYFLTDTSVATFHLQLTTITQYHGDFYAAYSGKNSLNPNAEEATSVTSTIFSGVRLWKNSAFYFDPEMAGGNGLSSVTGIAGFTNGETPRIGNPAPTITIARAYVQQAIGLPSDSTVHLADDQNNLAQDVPANRIMITAGKFALTDFFDGNSYSHDPRTQFENWALMDNGAWDYPANTHGYTLAVAMGITLADWSLRVSTAAEPTEANGQTLAYNAGEHGETFELEHRHSFDGQAGIIQLLVFNNTADMGNYDQALSNPKYDTNVVNTRQAGRNKYGFGLNVEQAIATNIGAFLRVGWNDGRNETWAFTEIDRTAALGFSFNGGLWHRNNDVAGIAGVINGLSQDHERYLAAGGYGFIIGDGALDYAPETIIEAYYLIALTDSFSLTADYQFVANPAYNADRGPVNVIGVRAHVGM
jgi:high affinity Mn2+ porin